MRTISLILLLISAISDQDHDTSQGQERDTSQPGYVGSIICFSDSSKGMKMAEAAALYLLSEGQEKMYDKSFFVTNLEDDDLKRLLILILSADGEKSLNESKAPYEKNLRDLLDKMKREFGDNRVSVILQAEDKTNILRSFYGDDGAIVVTNFQKMAATEPSTVAASTSTPSKNLFPLPASSPSP